MPSRQRYAAHIQQGSLAARHNPGLGIVTQRMASGQLENPSFEASFLKRPLQYGLVEMVPALFTGDPVGEVTGRRKHPLPSPLYPDYGSRRSSRSNRSKGSRFKGKNGII